MYLNTRIFSDYWLRTSAVIRVYKARAMGNAFRMFISVYILCNWHLAYCDHTRSKDHSTNFYTAITINSMDAQSLFAFLF